MTRAVTGSPAGPRQAGSRPSRRLALILTAAAFAAVTGVLLIELIGAVRSGSGPAESDTVMSSALIAARNGPVTVLAQAVTFLGSTICLVGLTGALAIWLGWRHRSLWGAVGVVGVMATSEIATAALKTIVGRHRPDAGLELGPLATDPAFPSGHTVNSTVFLGLLVAVAIHWSGDRRAVAPVIGVAALLLELGVGTSRVYLGYHWPTDVLGGWLLAGFLLSLASIPWIAITTRSP